MLLKNFYSVLHKESLQDGKASWQIELNPSHEIFKGHFPGNPITPGVSMIQTIKEISQELLEKKLFLESADNVKFMAIINPETDPILDMEISIEQREDKYKIKNVSKFGDTVGLKFSGTFRVI
ncbi:MAG: 3-hydroxyacyl-ACP dehydratase [Crocinitomicaceae bacterium]|nr:3-hydroxyacyl-ACP dehydratase [Crocinitomicaceae bacterium]|tara:strand:+ start:10853 stop:11221 length:369 start_codon:yes stop_codon:yes gene_type:complete